MGIKVVDIVVVLVNLVYCVYSEHILPCNVSALYPCQGQNQVCNQLTRQCVCKSGFTFVNDSCEIPSEDSRHTVTGIVVSVFTIALIACGIILVFRKYDLANYIRQKISMRRNNTAAYEDVMIGHDDPPLNP
ncbi:unnamed protein product [Diatraea saccharalis]|uniref:EGF-like domain-containing protein n=1 Tax=Diatraea saccharalis TaxID=40085 RepID=A0A9N9R8I0_9NEOP|nr:unnamed protein product [Diatraea saccharalis]